MIKGAEDVVVTFTDCDVGWVRFSVSRREQAVEIRASEVFDPFPDLVAWLEAIAVGVEECAFEIDEEGIGKRLECRRVCYDRFALTVKDIWGDGSVFVQGQIDPLQLVGEFYGKLRAFARSPGYRKEEWEIETIEDRLANLSEPPQRRSEIVRNLLALDRSKLRSTLFDLKPSYLITPAGAMNADRESVGRVDRLLSPNDPYLQKGFVQTREEWRIPEDYDLWPRARKAGLIAACLSESVSSCHGTRLGDIRSRIIEGWMRKETQTRTRALHEKWSWPPPS